MKELGLYDDELLKKISENYGSIQDLEEIPKKLQEVFVTSMDIHWLDHLVAQAILQRAITDSISKTINMPNDVSIEDVKQAYLIAHEMGCKGVTVYRDGSKTKQVLNIVTEKEKRKRKTEPSDYSMKLLEEILSKNKWMREYIKIGKSERGLEIKPPVISLENEIGREEEKKVIITTAEAERCPICGGEHLVYEAGCMVCKDCGWSECIIS